MISVIHITMVISLELIAAVEEYAAMRIAAKTYLNLAGAMVVLTVIATVYIIYALMEISVIVFKEVLVNSKIGSSTHITLKKIYLEFLSVITRYLG